ncbi:MAG TPA: hypothetical protein VM240_08765 [Verrucomicrobiae bacterium]|nr:hypothetical protein [Verrucomicrobiae bacterium]
MKTIRAVLAALALFTTGAAGADCDEHSHLNWNAQWDAGAAVMYDRFGDPSLDDGSLTTTREDEADIGYRVFVGVGFLQYFGIELGHADYGEARFDSQSDGSGSLWAAGPVTTTVSVEGTDLSVLGRVPISSQLNLVLSLGVLNYKAGNVVAGTTQITGPDGVTDSIRDRSPIYSARLEYLGLSPLRVGVSYGRTETNSIFGSEFPLESLALSLAYLF